MISRGGGFTFNMKKQEKSVNSGMMSPLTKRKNVDSKKSNMQNEPIYKMVKLQQC